MNKGFNKKYLVILMMVSISACSSGINTNVSKPATTFISEYNLDLGAKKGTTLSLKILPKSFEESFKTKAGANGTRAKVLGDVDHYLVYLVRNTNSAGFTPGGDPLANVVTNGGPFTVPNAGAASRAISFNNVPSDAPNYYYAVVKAQDASNNDLIKANTNFSGSPKIAISTFGVRVSASLAVSTATNMAITANLDDAIGASIEAGIVNNIGSSTLGTITGTYQTYNYSISTIAGISTSFGTTDTGIATTSQLNNPNGVAVDSSGNVYIANQSNHTVRKVTPTGVISTIAGISTSFGTTDTGIATTSQLNFPTGVAVDSVGNVYIADRDNHSIRKVTPTGVISTIAGIMGSSGTTNTGIANTSQLSSPYGVAVDSAGNVYIADSSNHRIRKVTLVGGISTISGTGTAGAIDTGIATTSQLNFPTGVAVDSVGNVYIADSNNHSIRKVTSGVISTIAGILESQGSTNTGIATTSQLNFPYGVAVDSAGNLYIANSGNHTIRKVTSGVISTIAGISNSSGATDTGIPTTSQLNLPYGVAVDSSGNFYIANRNNHTVRKLF